MIIVLGDLLADYSIRIEDLAIEPKDLQRVSYLELGPGGAGNVAIMAAHYGLEVACYGEVGDDYFGRLVIDSLAAEGIETSGIRVCQGARTPVANVLVDGRGEPAYLGFPGTLQIDRLPTAWHEPIAGADALFADGWAESDGIVRLVLETFSHAAEAEVPLFFDPGPGNPDVDNAWHSEAASLSTVVLATEEEAGRITGRSDAVSAARDLLANGPELVIIKRGVAGCLLVSADDLEIAPGFPVEARDATGAGDSFAAAIIFGYLRGLPLRALGTLANATGAAKVQKLGTGRNMPTLEEVEAIIQRFDVDDDPLALLDQ